MYPLTRPVRQGIATAILVGATMVPTVLVGIHAWRINRPGHIRDVEVELGRQLGMQVTLDAVSYPRPGEIVLRGVVLRQEEPRGRGLMEIARAGAVRVVRGDGELTIHGEDLRISGEGPRRLVAQAESLINRPGVIPFDRVHLAAPSCDVDLGGEGLTYAVQDLAAEFVADRARPSLFAAYRLAEAGPGTLCELALTRDRSGEVATTNLSFRTLEGPPLSARVLGPFFDTAAWLSPLARVEGELELSQSGTKEWEATFRGQLADIDLGAMVARQFPGHHLTGFARVNVDEARWGDRPGQGAGWREARGELLARNGTIGNELLGSLARELRFRLSPRIARDDPHRAAFGFHALGIRFDIAGNGEIRLAGALGDEFSPGAVVAGESSPLAFAPEGTASVHGLIKALVPLADNEPGIVVPLTAGSRVLLCLPVPPEVATRPGRGLGGN